MSTRALAELRRAGIDHTIHEYEAQPAAASPGHASRPTYGLDAAAALGVDPRRIFKTLVANVDERLAIAIVPVSSELDLKALADTLGGRRAEMAAQTDAERATGYVVGGISPIGQKRRLPTVLDVSASGLPTILVSAGRRGLQVELAPADLARVTEAALGAIARSSP